MTGMIQQCTDQPLSRVVAPPAREILHRRGQSINGRSLKADPMFLCLSRQLVYPSQTTCWSNWGFLWKGERNENCNWIRMKWNYIWMNENYLNENEMEWKLKRLLKWLTEQMGVWGPRFRTLTYDWMSPFAEKIVVQLVDMAQANENHAVDPYLWPEETSHHWMMKKVFIKCLA